MLCCSTNVERFESSRRHEESNCRHLDGQAENGDGESEMDVLMEMLQEQPAVQAAFKQFETFVSALAKGGGACHSSLSMEASTQRADQARYHFHCMLSAGVR